MSIRSMSAHARPSAAGSSKATSGGAVLRPAHFLLVTLFLFACKSREFNAASHELSNSNTSFREACNTALGSSADVKITALAVLEAANAKTCSEAEGKLAKIKALRLESKKLKDVSLLSTLTSLEVLYLTNNEVIDLTPLASLPKLKALHAEGNKIKDASVLKTFPSLKDVTLWNNPVNAALALRGLDLERVSGYSNDWPSQQAACASFKKMCSCVRMISTASLKKLTLEACPQNEGKACEPADKIERAPCMASVTAADALLRQSSSDSRYDILRKVPLEQINSAPGHEVLRDPAQMLSIADAIKASGGGRSLFDAAEPMIINVTTLVEARGARQTTRVRSVEIFDGNHRLAGGLHSGLWKNIGDVPRESFKIYVNGIDEKNQLAVRWVPLHTIRDSAIPPTMVKVLNPDGKNIKGPTAEIAADIRSDDELFSTTVQGVSMTEVVKSSLKAIGR